MKYKALKRFTTLFCVPLLAGMIFMMGCNDTATVTPNAKAEQNIKGLIESSAYKQSEGAQAEMALDSLAKYINTVEDLKLVLSGADDYTLFAPSNAAFVGLLNNPVFKSLGLGIPDINLDIIKSVMTYHLVATAKLKADFPEGTKLMSILPSLDATNTDPEKKEEIDVVAGGFLKTGATSNTSIVQADIRATNGVVHITDGILIPPSVGALLTEAGSTILAKLTLAGVFESYNRLITSSDNGFQADPTHGQFSIRSLLGSNKGEIPLYPNGFTVFVYPESLFPKINPHIQTELVGGTAGRQYILNHIINEELDYTALKAKDGQQLTTLQGQRLTVRVTPATPAGTPEIVTLITSVGQTVNLLNSPNTVIESPNGIIYVAIDAESGGLKVN